MLKIYVDMDGVLVNTHALLKRKLENNGRTTTGFWSSLPVGVHAFDLIHLLSSELDRRDMKLTDHLFILSKLPSYTNAMYGAAEGKVKWVERHFPYLADNLVLTRSRKDFVAHPKALLIDDDSRHYEPFRNAGGHVVPWLGEQDSEFTTAAWDVAKPLIQLNLALITMRV